MKTIVDVTIRGTTESTAGDVRITTETTTTPPLLRYQHHRHHYRHH